MNVNILQIKRAKCAALFVLLLVVAGAKNAIAQTGNIAFADADVKALCIANWDTNGDGELSYTEAAAVTALNDAFHGHPITSFDEFQYFIGVTAIEDLAFDYNDHLVSITLPNTITSIGYSFRNCKNLNSFYIPASVTEIHKNAFESCRHMEQIVVAENNPVYDSREGCNAIIETASNNMIIACKNTFIPNTVTSVDNTAFIGKDITSLFIPSSVVAFGSLNLIWCPVEQIVVDENNPVFDSRENCNAIIETSTNKLVKGCKNTVIPNTVTKIGESAFIDCDGITSITIPAAVTYIGLWAFRIQGLNSMTIEATTPPQLYWYDAWHSPFGGVSLDIPVYVPCGTIETYQNADVWSRFTNFIEMCNGDAPVGAINGLFTINGNGDQVYFSQGNLQYQASTNTWRFAEHQWDYVGEDNANASSTYEGWIDLYEWGTSGYDHGANHYLPWSSGGWNYDWAVYGDDKFDLCDRNGQADWGYNAISNGGNQERQWRTCKKPEWQYLLNNRQTASGIRFVKANVNEINGVIILPDNWNSNFFVLNNPNDGSVSYEANTISLDDWTDVFEVYGAVFLPANGSMCDLDFGLAGRYWTASHGPTPWFKSLVDFNDEYIHTEGSYYPNCKYSVRLVRAQANATYTIEAVSNPAEGGMVEGTGIYNYYASANLTAIPNEGYSFGCWKENGRVVSTDNTYEVLALFNRNLEAIFYETSTYPLTYSYNEETHTATVTGHWEGVELEGELVIPETVVHNEETYVVTAIERAFEGCVGLTSVVFPNSIVFIQSYAFAGCSGLTEITIPSSVTSIGGVNPFGNCHNLAQITVESGNAYYDSRDNCNAIIETGTNCLISGSSNTFIPNSVTSLGQDAFYGITMHTLTIYAETPPIVGVWALADVNRNIPVYVPCGSIEAYQNAEGWNEFTNFIEMCNGDAPVGAINGLFTINGNGDQVYFSQGNLQYQASTNTWRFAENQWDFVGNNEVGTVYENGVKSDNSLISSSYNGWIDLFGWGTSGHDHGAVCYQPWSISQNYSDYYAYGSSTNNLYEQSGQADWGYNAISNGGNQENLWRSLSNSEWNYLLNTRNTTSGIRFAKTYLNDIAGLVIMPDNWEESIYYFEATNDATASYSTNSIELTDWDGILQPAGVVFLPAAGSRKGMIVSSERINWGMYWTASCRSNSIAYPVSFSNSHLDPPNGYDNRFNGQAVRLVHTYSTISSYSINAVPNPFEGGTITGADNYSQGQNCTLAATPNEGYTFINWTRDNEVVATTETYSFTVTEAADYVANFELNSYTINATANPTEGGTIAGAGTYDHFSTCTLNATANEGYTFTNWTKDGEIVSTESVYNFTVTEDAAFVANFEEIQVIYYSISTSSNPSLGGSVIGIGSYLSGQTCTLTANANEGYTFGSWTENGTTVSTDATYSFIVDSDRTLVANFAAAGNYWTPENTSSYSLTMALTGIVQIDGVEQYSDQLEVAAFCGDECRGSQIASEFFLNNRYLVMLSIAGEIGDVLTFKLYDHGLAELNLTSPAPVTFNADGYGTPIEPYALNFISAFDINAAVDPEGAGIITGMGSYNGGATCTLVAEANTGYQFVNWTLDGNVVSTNATYTFTVTQAASYVAHFQSVHTQALSSGWNWYSTYIDQNGINGLAMLENSLGSNGVRIQSKSNGYVDQFEYNGTSYWYGTLNSLTNEQMYMVRTNTACNATMTGTLDPFSQHPITINNGWNWIGFPANESVRVSTALSGFTPEANDQIKSKNNGYSTYIVYGNNALWYGTLNTLEPGQGYMYKSNSNASKTLIYQNGRGETLIDNVTVDGNTFLPEEADYAYNMTVTAVVELDGVELRSEDYELAAFVGNECRGSVKLMYVEPLDRYMAFLLVSGDVEESLRFVLTDSNNTSWSEDYLMYNNDETVGTPAEPAVLHFGPLGMNENGQEKVQVYPNPSKDVFNIEGYGIRKVEIINAYGQVIYTKEVKDDFVQIDLGNCTVGVYLLRVVTEEGVTTQQIIKK